MKKHTASLSKNIHTINNLLTNINLSAELLQKEFYGPVNREQKKYLARILGEVKKIKKMVETLGN